jgi:hypothetical protein
VSGLLVLFYSSLLLHSLAQMITEVESKFGNSTEIFKGDVWNQPYGKPTGFYRKKP